MVTVNTLSGKIDFVKLNRFIISRSQRPPASGGVIMQFRCTIFVKIPFYLRGYLQSHNSGDKNIVISKLQSFCLGHILSYQSCGINVHDKTMLIFAVKRNFFSWKQMIHSPILTSKWSLKGLNKNFKKNPEIFQKKIQLLEQKFHRARSVAWGLFLRHLLGEWSLDMKRNFPSAELWRVWIWL